ncbi:hypothetical protein A5819_001815 [Enterococcus sp. 7E2_DIV0204]|uniref:LPXTG cell wall anchor domain-containing protein n=4 Tax=unclassified Enterococcus TaxID=2608891 RepID=UPI000A33448E|nr:LPXTG cell wall anchor domain-containing protein [Enterococcus sp. 7E2_DIV0204]OTN89323.1 hypothetical protein A5819_001815 [Enterococcus sp. 7E2_DIV0204]
MKKLYIFAVLLLLFSELLFPVNSLAETLNKQVVTDETSSSAMEVSNSTSEISNVAEEASNSTNEISNSAEEVSNSTSEISNAAEEVSNSTSETSSSKELKKSSSPLAGDMTENDITISAISEKDTESSPLFGDGVGYAITVKNSSSSGAYIPAGSIITFTISSDSSVAIDDLLSAKSSSVVNASTSPNLFSFVSALNGVVTIKINENIYPGTSSFNMYFYNTTAQYAENDGTIVVDLKGNISVSKTVENDLSKEFILNPSSVFIKVNKKNTGPVTLPGYVGYGSSDSVTQVLGADNNSLNSFLNSYGLYDPSYKYNGGLYMTFRSTFVKGYTGFSRGVLWGSADKKIPTNNFKLIVESYGTATDITNATGVVWTYTENGAMVDYSEWLTQNGPSMSNGGNITLYTLVPVNAVTDTVTFTGALGWDNFTKWSSTIKGMYSNPSTGSTIPYFRSVGNQTIYNTDTMHPMTGISAYSGSTDISSKIIITDYDGYPVDGKNPPVGNYSIRYSVTNDSNETTEYNRTITVIKNKQSITGFDYTMHVGDKDATTVDFKPSATDKEGMAIAVTADLSAIDFSKAGTYEVVLTAADGQTKTVKLIIKENKQSITGSDYTMHVGDKDATTVDFKPSATDKEGTAIAVTADLSAIDFSKAGTYEVILTAADGQTKTVKLTILSLPDIKATDKTMYVGDRLTKEDILNWATFINPEGMPVGFEVVGNAIPISATDQLTTSGTYTIKYYIQGKSRSVENILAEKEITLTVKEKEHPSVDPGKPKKSISKGNLTSKKKSLPNTGEQNTNTLYSIGILLLIMVLGGYTRMKYWKKK